MTTSLPAIYTDEPLETIVMQRSHGNTSSDEQYQVSIKDTLQLTVILYHLEGSGAACVQSPTNLTSYVTQGELHFKDLHFITRNHPQSTSAVPVLEVIQEA